MTPDRIVPTLFGITSLVVAGAGHELQAITVGIFGLTTAVLSFHGDFDV